MAKKKSTPKITRRTVYNKKTDTAEVHFYSGRKKATEAQRHQYIKANFDDLDKSQLTASDRVYYGRIEGGRNRANKSTRIDGKFISKEFEKANKLQEVAAARGFKNVNDLFENDPVYYTAIKDLYISDDGLKVSYTSDDVIDAIDTFSGHIFINGKEYTKLQAIEKVNAKDSLLKRSYSAFYIDYFVRYKKGGAEMHFSLPSDEKIRNSDIDEMLDYLNKQEDENEQTIKINYSGDLRLTKREVKQMQKEQSELLEDKGRGERFSYTVKIITKQGRHATKKIKAGNKRDAAYKIQEKFKGSILIDAERIATPKKKAKKKK